jgi:phage terminase large subunit-like protein
MCIAENYISDVLEGRQPAGPWIIKGFKRHRRDLERTDIYFDPERGQRVIDFCEELCIPSDRTTPMVLAPWQQAVLYITYGWMRRDGFRRFRKFYLEIAKKNGKTGLAAALIIYSLIADGEPSPRVFVAATTGKQAKECFKEAAAMVSRNPELRSAIHLSGKGDHIYALFTDDLGRCSMMSRDAASEDGAVVSTAILDELHRWKNTGGLYSVLRYGTTTRKQPMMGELTTAGASAGGTSPCWLEREYGTKVLDGHATDDEFAPWIFCMDDKDDWKDPANWIKANPSLGYLLDVERLKHDFQEVQGKPTDLGEFKRFRLNIWSSEAENPAIEIEKWDACCRVDITKHPDPRRLRAESIAQLKGRRCFAAIDLAPKLDTSALVLLFPPEVVGEKWRIIPYFWIPEDNIAARVKRDRVPYDRWRDAGFLTATPGNLTDVRYIANQIVEINKQFDLRELAYDDAWSSELIRLLGEEGFPMQKFLSHPQSHAKMNGPSQELMRKILRQEFAHDNDPVARWQMSNLRWNVQKGTNFIKPDKSSKREKIDFCSSLIMALSSATSPDNIVKPKRPFYVVTSR